MSVFTEALKKREVKAKAFDAEGNEVQVRAVPQHVSR